MEGPFGTLDPQLAAEVAPLTARSDPKAVAQWLQEDVACDLRPDLTSSPSRSRIALRAATKVRPSHTEAQKGDYTARAAARRSRGRDYRAGPPLRHVRPARPVLRRRRVP